jgi:hypothetical protein
MPSKTISFNDMTVIASEGMFGGSTTFQVKIGSEGKSFTQSEFAECVYPVFKAMFSAPPSPPSS